MQILGEEIRRYKKQIIVGLTGIVVILASGVVAYNVIDLGPKVSGVLYTSMARDGEVMGILGYDFNNPEVGFQDSVSFPGATVMQAELSTEVDGDMFFVYAPLIPNASTTEVSNILSINGSTDAMRFVLPDDNTLRNERNLDYSEQVGLLTFSAQEFHLSDTDISVPTSVEDWGIYVADPETQEIQWIGAGIAPAWAPGGTSIIYLGIDGIKQYIFETNETIDAQTPFGNETYLGSNMNMDISPDGSSLVLTSPNQGGIYFLEINDWNTLKVSMTDKPYRPDSANISYYWPTFSPDGNFVAVQAADFREGKQGNPRIEIIRLTDMRVVQEVSLQGYDFTQSFVDDWL